MTDISITCQFAPRQIRCNEEVKVMCDFLQLHDRSPTSAAKTFMETEQLTICCLNIQSLSANLEDLKSDPLVTSCNVLMLCETWLESEHPDPVIHPKFLKVKHLKGQGRGLSAFSTEVNTDFSINSSLIKVTLPSKRFSMIGVYRTHQSCESAFMNSQKNVITDNTALIVGDFNSANFSKIGDLLKRLGFAQVVSAPTHRAGNKLDPCFVQFLHVSFFIHPCYYSHNDRLCITVRSI